MTRVISGVLIQPLFDAAAVAGMETQQLREPHGRPALHASFVLSKCSQRVGMSQSEVQRG